ncbi:DUF6367 family protein [Allochromatium vinosum]|nr:DUF6367 family protein [Allochromatium vinosum]
MSFKEFLAENGIDYFVIEVPEEFVPEIALLNEGKWVDSGKKDYMQRVDAENPSIKQRRHVHIAKSKHINNKNMQASWNDDGTKHDKKTFNSKIGSISTVQDIARQALGLKNDFKLEEAAKAPNLLLQLNEALDIGVTPVLFIAKLA